jgi:hypothetical protein
MKLTFIDLKKRVSAGAGAGASDAVPKHIHMFRVYFHYRTAVARLACFLQMPMKYLPQATLHVTTHRGSGG